MRSFSVVTVALSVGFFAGDLFGQCANGGGTTVSAGATQSASSARRLTPSASISGASGVPRRGSFSVGSVPQVSSFRMGSGTSALNSFQTHQLMNYRALAESGVRNRRSPERKQQMLATNAERAYRSRPERREIGSSLLGSEAVRASCRDCTWNDRGKIRQKMRYCD